MPDWIERSLPEWLIETLRFLASPRGLTVSLLITAVLLVGSAWAVRWYVLRLPPDVLLSTQTPGRARQDPTGMRLLVLVARNLLGAILLLAGIAMLVLPGQGLLTMAIGLALLDLPFKWRLTRAILSYRPVLAGINRLRTGARLPPLEQPAKPRDAP
jgi:hypothetical protein